MSKHVLKVTPENSQTRLDVFLTQSLPDVPSRTFVQKLIEEDQVKVNQKKARSNYKVREGDEIEVLLDEKALRRPDLNPENIPLDIFYEDEDLLIINKASGMLVHPAQSNYSGTLVNALLGYSRELSDVNSKIRPGIVHRLDQETSGLMVVAKDNRTHVRLARQFQKHQVRKRYTALVEGHVEFDGGKIDAPLGRNIFHREKKAVQFDDDAKDAVTYYKVIKASGGATLIALFPETGRTHQLRVHMAHIGHPILGDEKYGKKNTFPRLALHAHCLAFTHPRTKVPVEFSAPPPKEFYLKVGINLERA